MCFDKMESGLLELHKEEIEVVPFLKECFFSFRAEALVMILRPTLHPTNESDLIYDCS